MTRDLIVGSFPKHRFLSGALAHELPIYRVAENFLLRRGVPHGTRIQAEFIDGILVLVNKDKNSFGL